MNRDITVQFNAVLTLKHKEIDESMKAIKHYNLARKLRPEVQRLYGLWQNYLSLLYQECQATIVDVTLYSAPISTDSDTVENLDEPLEITGYTFGIEERYRLWYKVNKNGTTMWVSSNDTQPSGSCGLETLEFVEPLDVENVLSAWGIGQLGKGLILKAYGNF